MTTPEDPFQPPQEGTPPTQPPQPPQPPQYGAPPAAPPYGAAPPPYTGQPGSAQMPYGGAPTYGGVQLAAWGWRVLGYLIDAIIVAVPSVIVGVATGSRLAYDLISLLGGLTIGYLNGAQGQSPGKRAVGLKLLSESTGEVIGGGMGIVRAIAHLIDTIACLIGWFWPLWDAKRQTFADKIIGTVVIKT
jgi:uncharacterized RDD family membrane protein YckC